jgi:predicted RNA-binding Zn-ribbon protein involved in translation (DUF1610 family)
MLWRTATLWGVALLFEVVDMPKKNRRLFNCLNCGKEKEVIQSRKDKYCCNSCAKEHTVKTKNIELICSHCGDVFMRQKNCIKHNRGKFCSKDCAVESLKNGNYFNCKNCGELFYRSNSRIKRGHIDYCTTECYADKKTIYANTARARALIRARNHCIISRLEKQTGLNKKEIPDALFEAKVLLSKLVSKTRQRKNEKYRTVKE